MVSRRVSQATKAKNSLTGGKKSKKTLWQKGDAGKPIRLHLVKEKMSSPSLTSRRNNAENSIWTLHYAWGWINFLGAQRERMQFKVLCRRQTKPGDKLEEPAGPLVPADLLFLLFSCQSELMRAFSKQTGMAWSTVLSGAIGERIDIANNRRHCGLLGNCGNVGVENRLIVPASARQAST